MRAPTPVRAAPATTTAPPPASRAWPSRAGSRAPSPSCRCAPVRPEQVVFHLGPTNSGKTYDSLLALEKNGRGVYAAPLRQLAHEAYARLSAQLPAGTVGLSTGEEEIDPDAPIVCCTVEKAPMRGDLLVLDESHWVADPDRGHHWARLVLTGEYREMHLISAAEAYLLLKPLVVRRQEDHGGQPQAALAARRPPGAGPRRGRAAADAGRRLLPQGRLRRRRGARPAPPGQGRRPLRRAAARPPGASVIDRFTSGEPEVLVTTDVIGHGINVPATTVLFAETDQVRRRRAPRAAHLGDRPDRRPRRALRPDRARRGRRPRRGHRPQAGRRPAHGRRRGRPRRRDERPAQAGAAAAPGARRPRRLRAGRPARGAHPLDGVGPRGHPRPGDDRRRRDAASSSGCTRCCRC